MGDVIRKVQLGRIMGISEFQAKFKMPSVNFPNRETSYSTCRERGRIRRLVECRVQTLLRKSRLKESVVPYPLWLNMIALDDGHNSQ
jgi:hypothetical protein